MGYEVDNNEFGFGFSWLFLFVTLGPSIMIYLLCLEAVMNLRTERDLAEHKVGAIFLSLISGVWFTLVVWFGIMGVYAIVITILDDDFDRLIEAISIKMFMFQLFVGVTFVLETAFDKRGLIVCILTVFYYSFISFIFGCGIFYVFVEEIFPSDVLAVSMTALAIIIRYMILKTGRI